MEWIVWLCAYYSTNVEVREQLLELVLTFHVYTGPRVKLMPPGFCGRKLYPASYVAIV